MRGRIREIRKIDLVLYFILPLIILLVLLSAAVLISVFVSSLHIAITVTVALLLSYFPLKYFAIGCVLMYKAFAPLHVRERCRFDPCCSTYMIMSIQKYGLFRGVFRGIKRIIRCKPPNGGKDLP